MIFRNQATQGGNTVLAIGGDDKLSCIPSAAASGMLSIAHERARAERRPMLELSGHARVRSSATSLPPLSITKNAHSELIICPPKPPRIELGLRTDEWGSVSPPPLAISREIT